MIVVQICKATYHSFTALGLGVKGDVSFYNTFRDVKEVAFKTVIIT